MPTPAPDTYDTIDQKQGQELCAVYQYDDTDDTRPVSIEAIDNEGNDCMTLLTAADARSYNRY